MQSIEQIAQLEVRQRVSWSSLVLDTLLAFVWYAACDADFVCCASVDWNSKYLYSLSFAHSSFSQSSWTLCRHLSCPCCFSLLRLFSDLTALYV